MDRLWVFRLTDHQNGSSVSILSTDSLTNTTFTLQVILSNYNIIPV